MNTGTPLYICTHSRNAPWRDSSTAPLVRTRPCSVRRLRRDITSAMFLVFTASISSSSLASVSVAPFVPIDTVCPAGNPVQILSTPSNDFASTDVSPLMNVFSPFLPPDVSAPPGGGGPAPPPPPPPQPARERKRGGGLCPGVGIQFHPPPP